MNNLIRSLKLGVMEESTMKYERFLFISFDSFVDRKIAVIISSFHVKSDLDGELFIFPKINLCKSKTNNRRAMIEASK